MEENRRPNTKLEKSDYLSTHEKIRELIPETLKADRETLETMLSKYGMVYVKPNIGTGGKGVMRVTQSVVDDQMKFGYQLGRKSFEFPDFSELYSSLEKRMAVRTHLVQKGIHLLSYRKRPFDIRIMVQKNTDGIWENTGIIGRLAHPGKVVTNYHSGGTPLSVSRLLRPYMDKSQRDTFLEKMGSLGVQIASYLHAEYPQFNEFGVDVGLDNEMKPWIFEVNTSPDPFIFKRLKDKSVFRRVIRLARANGRFRIRKGKRIARG